LITEPSLSVQYTREIGPRNATELTVDVPAGSGETVTDSGRTIASPSPDPGWHVDRQLGGVPRADLAGVLHAQGRFGDQRSDGELTGQGIHAGGIHLGWGRTLRLC